MYAVRKKPIRNIWAKTVASTLSVVILAETTALVFLGWDKNDALGVTLQGTVDEGPALAGLHDDLTDTALYVWPDRAESLHTSGG